MADAAVAEAIPALAAEQTSGTAAPLADAQLDTAPPTTVNQPKPGMIKKSSRANSTQLSSPSRSPERSEHSGTITPKWNQYGQQAPHARRKVALRPYSKQEHKQIHHYDDERKCGAPLLPVCWHAKRLQHLHY